MVDRALLIMKNFYMSVFSPNNTSALLIFKKGNPRITSNLILAIKNIF